MILSSSFLASSPKEGLHKWEEFLKNLKFRRADKFSLALLCGALACAKDYDLTASALYFGTSNGSVESVKELQDNIFLQNRFPMPFTFINTLSGTPLFFLLKHLNIQIPTISVAHSNFAFENTLSLALVDLKQKRIKSALIGVCDVWYEPIEQARKILDYESCEFSAWILVEHNEKDCVKFFNSFDELLRFINQFETNSFYLSPSFSPNEYDKLKNTVQIRPNIAPKTISNYSAAAAGAHFSDEQTPFFYIGCDNRGGYSFVNIN
ncbi:MAG: hypothetical protein LBC08_04175 [Campylobacteraceae bacterium]|jgi:hypothetical protein|nr:hypothetical protein [Campylobacteraceae bacterium]